MNIFLRKQIAFIFFEKVFIALISTALVVLAAALELPTIDYPMFSFFDNKDIINPWSDIFLANILFVTKIFMIMMCLSFIVAVVAYWLSGRIKFIWRINIFIGIFVQVVLLWINILWVHSLLFCANQALRNEPALFGCLYADPTPLQFVAGVVGSIIILLFEVFYLKQYQKIFLNK